MHFQDGDNLHTCPAVKFLVEEYKPANQKKLALCLLLECCMEVDVNFQEVLLGAPFAADLTNLIHHFIDNYLFQVFSGISEPLSFSSFHQLWKESNFEVLHDCCPKRSSAEHFLQQLFQVALLFFKDPSLVRLPRMDEYLKDLKEELHHVIRIASIYLVYLLYATQRVQDTRQTIRVTISELDALLNWLLFQKRQDRKDGTRDALKIFIYLLHERAFRLSYLRLPIQLPPNLMEPLYPCVISEYELEVTSCKKRSKAHQKLDEGSNEVESLWTRIGEILTRVELQKLEKCSKRWEVLSKILEEQKPPMSLKDIFYEDIYNILERHHTNH